MNPLNIHQKRQNHSESTQNPVITDPDGMTFGPNNGWIDAWKDILLWARQHDVDKTLNLLIDTFNLQGSEIKEVPFRNIIDILTHDHSLKLLKSWATTDPLCADLYLFATAARTEFDLNQNGICQVQRAKERTYEKLPVKQYYLLLLFLRTLPFNKSSNEIHWMLTIQVWVLVHAMYRVKKGIYFSPNIQSGISYLRKLIFETDADWSSLLQLQQTTEIPSSFISLNTHLIQRIAPLIEITRNKDQPFQNFLPAVERIATNEQEEVVSYSSSKVTPLYIVARKEKTLEIDGKDEQWLPCLPVFPDNDDSEDGAESGIGYSEVPIDGSDSYIHQKLSSKSRLIAHSEHLSHLPWSWDRPSPPELIDLSTWVTDSWKSEDKKLALLAALVWIATNTGRTLVRVLDFPVKDEPGNEWTLIPDGSSLRRTPPVRENPWIPSTPEENQWVEQMADFNEVALPPEIQNTLNSMSDSVTGSGLFLANYWRKVSPEEIEVYFNMMMTGSLNRLKSGMLSNVLSQSTFELTNNSHLAQMVGGHPQLALTGAFAYCSWNCLKVNKATADIHRCLDENFEPVTSSVIAFGSRVNPREELLQQTIEQASKKVLAIDRNANPIEFHNAYVSYLMVSLWAATGVRPVIDSFESINHFNFEEGFVFINDKACDEKRMGRLVPLPSSISNLLQCNYRDHLQLLAQAIKQHNNELTQEIGLIVDEAPSGRLPYFFHINPKTLDWKSISPSGIDRQELFNWPLRHNLFRQRLAKRLPDMGVDQEIVDAYLGHKDAGMDSYGDFSIRSWLDDLNSARSSVDDAFEQLGFIKIPTWSATPSIAPVDNFIFTLRAFGIEQRAINRKEQHNKIVQEAELQIETHLGERTLDELANDEILDLEKKLATLPNDKSHPFALLKLSFLSDLVDEVWENKSKRIQLSKRLTHIQDNLTNVKHSTPLYYSIFNELRVLFNSEYNNITPSRTSIAESRFLVVLALLFENRICYERLLTDIFNQSNLRLVKYKKRFYLEYSEILDNGDHLTPVQRHLITPKTAHLINNLLKSKKSNSNTPALCNSIIAKVTELAPHLKLIEIDQIISNLSRIIDQANDIELPGTVSAFLSGRVRSCSLGWHDWIRLSQNKILHLPGWSKSRETEDSVEKLLERESNKYDASVIQTTDKEQLQIQAKEFFNQVRNELNGYKPSRRSDTTKHLSKIIRQHEKRVSSAIVLVGRWILEVIKRGKFKGGKTYAKDSPSRYFSAISSTFEQLAYHKDLLLMDSESVTELYSEFLNATKELEGSYHANRLLSFHHYCKKEGVEDPEWADLDLPSSSRSVSPGIVTESDYLKSLDIILSQRKLSDSQKQHMAFFLVLCFRFGLRSMEAIGLTRDDWIEKNKYIYLLIQNNHIRTLKTGGSRRIIPLLFNLTDTEERLITEVLSQHESNFHNKGSHSLFALPGMKINKDMEFIRHTLIQILRKITGNPKIVNHHLRHSFSNSTSTALYHLELEPWGRLIIGESSNEKICTTTLGTNRHISSRSSMAAARLLGHTHPRTDALSYQHFYGEWANSLVGINDNPTEKSLDEAFNLDKDFKISSVISTKPAAITIEHYHALTLSNIMRVLSLVSNGKSFESAARMLYLDPKHTEQLSYVVSCVGHKGTPRNERDRQFSSSNMINIQWLSSIKRTDWQCLIILTSNLDKIKLPRIENLININRIADMIGSSRQLTLWNDSHFIAINEFLSFFGISIDSFNIVSYHKETAITDLANDHDFIVNPNIKRSDLDAGVEVNSTSGVSHENRINLIYKKGENQIIKNSYQLTACLIAFLVCSNITV